MSLLRKTKMDTRRKRVMLIVLSLLLLVPCLAAASFAMRFDLKGPGPLVVQDPAQQDQEKREREETERMRARARVLDEQEIEERAKMDPRFREEILVRQERELKMMAIRQSALVKLARISMDQAIQVAVSQKPGKVLECTLDAEHWKEPGKLADDGIVFYRVLIVPGEDVESGAAALVWVNAIDGSIIKTETELRRKIRRPE